MQATLEMDCDTINHIILAHVRAMMMGGPYTHFEADISRYSIAPKVRMWDDAGWEKKLETDAEIERMVQSQRAKEQKAGAA